MEKIIVILIITAAATFLLRSKFNAHQQRKCSDCSATSCTSCPLATAPTLKKHLETRKTSVTVK